MYILHLSDFHFNHAEDSENRKRYDAVLEEVIREVRGKAPAGVREVLMVVVCGDIIDQKKDENQGKTGGYAVASPILHRLKDALSEKFDIHFGFVPGNHDLVGGSFDALCALSRRFGFPWDFTASGCTSVQVADTDFLFVSSVNDDITRGHIDFDALEALLAELDPERRKVLVLHHTIMSMDDGDTSSIVNAARLVSILDRARVSLVLHGHTHGFDATPLSLRGCLILGVGALFSRQFDDVNSQFNLISLDHGVPAEITNYTYHHDTSPLTGSRMLARPLLLPAKGAPGIFCAPRISESYRRLLDSLRVNKRLYNVSIRGSYPFREFEADVMEHFGHLEEFGRSYCALAKDWQSSRRPDYLCFNHGEYYLDEENTRRGCPSGIDHIIEILRKKKTSSRAVLSTVGMREVYGAGEDALLPSLMVIQFGFDQDEPQTLKMTMYLRALEACRFLKINICELLYLARKLKAADISFQRVEVAINAFRVQCQEQFNCFIKSELDRLPDEDIQDIVTRRDYLRIAELLEGKGALVETVVLPTGLETLRRKMNWYGQKYEPYSDRLTSALDDAIRKLNGVRERRERTSVYEALKEDEQQLRESILRAAQAFRAESPAHGD